MATKTYLYQVDKKVLKQGAILTDEGGNTVYEAKMLKNSGFEHGIVFIIALA